MIAGTPTELPGGPHIAAVAEKLESWGWAVTRETDKMKTNWVAVQPNTGSIVWYTGAYSPDDLPKIFSSIKVYVNTTSSKYAPEHLEYVTMEALDAGCAVIAPDDWPDYHYGATRPVVTSSPDQSYRVRKGNRIIYNDLSLEAPDTTYRPLGEIFSRALEYYRTAVASEARSTRLTYSSGVTAYNREVLLRCHSPQRAATAYLRALGLS